MYAAIFGWFSFVWFGWAQEAPPSEWRIWLGIGAAVALITGIAGAILSFYHWHSKTALAAIANFNWYLIIFAAEVILILAGSLLLLWLHKEEQVAPFISLLVALHFVGLKFVFQDELLFLLAGLMLIVTFAAYPLANYLHVSLSALIGGGNGVILLGFAWVGLLRFLS
ncbi:hypothetical protein FD46_GL001586 [Liquorilactobacillus oeni DSM 19972]|uniref:Uncharacterized protein n=2 Tax=Liquorilactobacillus oeni TaxID=303241 RepID=A0A0R1MKJ7_9LACO|nr:hypothetical protein FD46_GL001586 [Liquorilactobacillus oeni DSM 19972]